MGQAEALASKKNAAGYEGLASCEPMCSFFFEAISSYFTSSF